MNQARERLIADFDHLATWTDVEFAALLCGVHPRVHDKPYDEEEALIENRQRDAAHTAVKRALKAGELKPVDVEKGAAAQLYGGAVHLLKSDAVKWAKERSKNFPNFPAFTAGLNVRGQRWPWGDYETPMLRALADAARELWSTYDPEQPNTAPKRDDVIDWLMGEPHKLTKNQAEAVASILRDPKLPTGRRG